MEGKVHQNTTKECHCPIKNLYIERALDFHNGLPRRSLSVLGEWIKKWKEGLQESCIAGYKLEMTKHKNSNKSSATNTKVPFYNPA